MKCIDAIEGTVKGILQQLHTVSIENRLDDSEYVRESKAVIDATEQFTRANPEVVDNPELLTQVLYLFSRNLWLSNLKESGEGATENADAFIPDDEEYQTYYFDYLYHRGVYPK